ncbi:MAG TPA: TRAP transporter substrate-binding protein [Stellaceae bacterium]|nr:TRAP transporter substrate-binding protein [Stellaceae bacterium]
MQKTSYLAAITLAFGLAVLAPPAPAADYVMKFGIATVNDAQHHYLLAYKDALEKASNGKIEVQVYPASQLGAIPVEIQGVQLGSIQAFMAPVDFFTGIDPRYSVFAAPMLFASEPQAAKSIHDPTLEPKVLALAEPKGLVGMSLLAVGASHYAARKPILRLADFKGKKLRINGSDLERAKMSALGASGIAMALSEVMPALDQGTIDGTISGFAVFVPFKMNTLVHVVTVTNDTQLISIAMVSKRWLDGLPSDLRKLVLDTGHALEPTAQADALALLAKLQQQWVDMGGEVHQLPPEDLAQMKKLLTPVGDEVTKSQPAVHDFYEQVRAVSAKN